MSEDSSGDSTTQVIDDPSIVENPTLSQARGYGGRNIIRLAFVIAIVLFVGYQAHILGTLAVVGAIIAMIMIHELGHYVTAKLSKMKVTEYFLGFGPRLWSTRRGETEYGVKALPLGGYVKIIGMSSAEEVDPKDEARTFRQATFPRRLAVGLAGSFMHFVMAFFLIMAVLIGYGYANAHVIEVGEVAHFQHQASPAELSGLRVGDIITSIDGKPLHSATVLSTILGSSIGKPVTLVIDRNGHQLTKVVVPVDGKKVKIDGTTYLPKGDKARGVIGIGLVAGTTKASFFGAIGRSAVDLASFTWATITALAAHFSPHGITQYFHQLVHPSTNPASPGAQSRFASPVGIVRLASQAAGAGVETVLGLLVSINVFVGIFNMIPLPPLDGGHVIVAIYERIRSRKGRTYHVDIMKLMPLTYAVIILLIALSVSALYLDITHPISNPFG